jgi:hypothetical protein
VVKRHFTGGCLSLRSASHEADLFAHPAHRVNPAVEALALEYAQFNLGDIQPAPEFRCVVYLQSFRDAPRLLGRSQQPDIGACLRQNAGLSRVA